jgi:uncharacterized protein (DUF1015 family)
MSRIIPFTRFFYDTKRVRIEDVISFPPDLSITKDEINLKNPYQINHLLKAGVVDKYPSFKKVGKFIESMLSSKVIVEDDSQSFYVVKEIFYFKKEKKERIGLFALVKIDDDVISHEEIDEKRTNRFLKLLNFCKMSVTPIFSIFKKKEIKTFLEEFCINNKSFFNFSFVEPIRGCKIKYYLWRINDSKTIEKIQKLFRNTKIYIADGHHRYEALKRYKVDYALMCLYEYSQSGIMILPIHRLVNAIKVSRLVSKLSLFFSIKEIFTSSINNFLLMLKKFPTSIGMYTKNRYYILSDNENSIDKLQYVLKDEKIDYIVDEYKAISLVNHNKYSHAFFLNPLTVNKITSMIRRNKKLPIKSTYFFPKILAGVIMTKVESAIHI